LDFGRKPDDPERIHTCMRRTFHTKELGTFSLSVSIADHHISMSSKCVKCTQCKCDFNKQHNRYLYQEKKIHVPDLPLIENTMVHYAIKTTKVDLSNLKALLTSRAGEIQK